MSRWDSDVDYYESQDGPQTPSNATCTDCGDPFLRERADAETLCDTCCDQRDAHASALEIRLAAAAPEGLTRMAKAILSTDLSTIREVA